MIRVIIERRVRDGEEVALLEMLLTMRNSSIHQPGYISGETLVAQDDPCMHLVISTWQSSESWQAWANSVMRQAMEDRVQPLLSAPARTTIFHHASRDTLSRLLAKVA